MGHAPKIPDALAARAEAPLSRGTFDGEWFTEEDFGVMRLGMRVRKKLHEETSAFQKISVYDTSFYGRLLTLDDAVMLTERDEFVYHEMMVHVPLCTLPEPRSVLIIGGGDCGCLREALGHPGIERVVQCDIDERVTRVCEEYFPWVRTALADPRATVLFDDGVRYIREQGARFDLIIVDGIDPTGPGLGLFLRDFHQSVARALEPGGVMTMQTETPHWDPAMLSAIYQELGAAYRYVSPYLVMLPSYPTGTWTLAYGSNAHPHDAFFAAERAAKLAGTCRYYNPAVHRAAFALPTEVAHALGVPGPTA